MRVVGRRRPVTSRKRAYVSPRRPVGGRLVTSELAEAAATARASPRASRPRRRQGLHEHVAERGRLDRAGEHRATASRPRSAGTASVARAAPDHVHASTSRPVTASICSSTQPVLAGEPGEDRSAPAAGGPRARAWPAPRRPPRSGPACRRAPAAPVVRVEERRRRRRPRGEPVQLVVLEGAPLAATHAGTPARATGP